MNTRSIISLGAAAAALLLGACSGGTDEDQSAAVLQSEAVGSSGDSILAGTVIEGIGSSDGNLPPALASVSPITELEEAPVTEAETLADQLEASDFVAEEATAPDIQAIQQTTCSGLADTVVATHQGLLDQLGTAGRTDDEAINNAFEQFGLNGELITRKAADLGCSPAEFDTAVCVAGGQLQPYGDVGSDLVAIVTNGCS